jgi:hypothetical protein
MQNQTTSAKRAKAILKRMNETSSKYISQAERLAIKINHLVAKFEQDNDTDTLDRLKPMLQHWKLIHGESRRSWQHVIECIKEADNERGIRQLISTPEKADAIVDSIDWTLCSRDLNAGARGHTAPNATRFVLQEGDVSDEDVSDVHNVLYQAESFLTTLHTQM